MSATVLEDKIETYNTPAFHNPMYGVFDIAL